MFVFTALLEFAFVNYASRRDSRNSKAAKSAHIYFYTGELGMQYYKTFLARSAQLLT